MVRVLGLVGLAAGELAVLVACTGAGNFGSRQDGHVKVLGNPSRLKKMMILGLASAGPPHGTAEAFMSPPAHVCSHKGDVNCPAEIASTKPPSGTTVARMSSPIHHSFDLPSGMKPTGGAPWGALPDTFTNVVALGSGSFGSVYSATYENRQVAVKLPSKFSAEDHFSLPPQRREQALQELFREFNIGYDMKYGGGLGNEGSEYFMGSIENNIHEVREHGVQPYMVFEFCGTNLEEFLERRRGQNALSEALLLDIYTQLLEALAYLRRHPNRWVHRDVALDNIGILEIDGKVQVRLMDFGLAVKGLPGHEKDCLYARTTHCPPAVFRTGFCFDVYDDPTDVDKFSSVAQSCDVHSLSIVFLQMLGIELDTACEIASRPPITPAETASKVDEVVRGIVDLDRDPDIRDVIESAIESAIRCFDEVPEERPTAEELLKSTEVRHKPHFNDFADLSRRTRGLV